MPKFAFKLGRWHVGIRNRIQWLKTQINDENEIKIMTVEEKYIRTERWFAWRPVNTENAGWVWLKRVSRTTDDCPLVFLGLESEIKYSL